MHKFSLMIGTALPLLSLLTPALAEEQSAWRLFVSDHAKPLVSAVDLETAEGIGQFPLGSPASLYLTASKQAVYAVQGEAGVVSAIGTGIAFEDHGDHGDIDISDPALIEATVTGDRPVHFVEHDGEIAIFFDGSGKASLVEEGAWLDGQAEVKEFTVAAPHHGVAAPVGDYMLLSEPNPTDPTELPIGINVIGPEGNAVGNLHECPDLHGEASSGDTLAIACAAGILLVKQAATGPEIELLPYADTLPEGKSTTLLGGVGLQYWLGNYGADKVVLIDPSSDDAFRLVDLPSRRVHFAVDPINVKFAYILTEDGDLHQLNVISGAITKTVSVTEPYSMDGEWSDPRPRIAVAGDEIAITDPLKSVVHIVDAASFAFERDIAVEGAPYQIVAVGGSGESHDH